jgi:AcrR family transcriptional regulator
MAHRAILEAVIALIAEGTSLSNLSVEAVAARAGVGKATIYRRWPNLDALFLDAFDSTISPAPNLPGRSVREDLLLLLDAVADNGSGVRQLFNSRVYAARLVEGARNPEFMRRYRKQVVEPRRKILVEIIRRGQKNGELRPDIDLEIALHLLITPVLHRLMSMQAGEQLPKDFIRKLVDSVLTGLGHSGRRDTPARDADVR